MNENSPLRSLIAARQRAAAAVGVRARRVRHAHGLVGHVRVGARRGAVQAAPRRRRDRARAARRAAGLVDYKVLQHWTGPLAVVRRAAARRACSSPGSGIVANGQRNWLTVGGIRLFQPSEPAKLLLIVIVAAVIAQFKGRIDAPRDVATRARATSRCRSCSSCCEPDLGTGARLRRDHDGHAARRRAEGRAGSRCSRVVGGAARRPCVLQPRAVLKQYQKDRLTRVPRPDRRPEGRRLQPRAEQDRDRVGRADGQGAAARARRATCTSSPSGTRTSSSRSSARSSASSGR